MTNSKIVMAETEPANLKPASEENFSEELLRRGIKAFVLAGVFALLTFAIYVVNFGSSLSSDRDDWGVFGDYLGGVLNPVIGLVTVFLVLINVRLQRQELKNSLVEMRNSNEALKEQNASIELQNFQNTFFNWLNSYNNIASNIEVTVDSGHPTYKGYRALSHLYKNRLHNNYYFQNLVEDLKPADRGLFRSSAIIEDASAAFNVELSCLRRWKEIKAERDDFFEGGFRSLIGIIEWAHLQPVEKIPESKKNEVFGIIRTQLTNAEKTFILYETWKLDSTLREAVAKYRLLDSLEDIDDPLVKFMMGQAKHLKTDNTEK